MLKSKIIEFHFLLLFVGYPVAAAVCILSGIGTLTIFYRAILLITSLLLISKLTRNSVRKNDGIFLIALMIFWALYQARIFVDVGLQAVYSMELRHYTIEFWLQLIIPTLSVISLSGRGFDQNRFLRLFLMVSLIALAFNFYYGYVDAMNIMTYGIRWGTEKINPITLGHNVVTFWLAFYCVVRTKKWGVVLAVLVYIALLPFLFVTGSRGPLLAYFILLFFILFYERKYFIICIATISIVSMIIALFAFKTIIGDQFETATIFIDRLANAGSSNDASSSIRMRTYMEALGQFANAPILGDALEEKTENYYPHNIIIEALMALGVIGGSLLLYIFGWFYYRLFSFRRLVLTPENNALYFFALVGTQYFFAGQFSSSVISATLMFPSIVAFIGLSYAPRFSKPIDID